MIPLIYKFTFNTPTSQWVLYGLALAIIVYMAWSGARGAVGPLDPKKNVYAPATFDQKLTRAAMYGVAGAVAMYFLFSYALPPNAPFRGGKGEGIPIHTYGILLMAGFLCAVNVASRVAGKEWPGEQGVKMRELIQDQFSMLALISGVLGSRLLFVLVNFEEQGLGGLFSLSGGLVFYGGLLGAIAASVVFSRVHGISSMRLADVCIPTVSLGQCLGRLGCFSAGCCWGEIAKPGLAWAAHFPGAQEAKNLFGQLGGTASLAYQSQAEDKRYVIEATGQVVHDFVPGAVRISEWVHSHGHTLGLHPTQLYESIGQLGLFVGLMAMRRYRRFHGHILSLWLMSYAVLRSTVELFRGDLERGTLHGLLQNFGMNALAEKVPLEAWYNISTSQAISLAMFGMGAGILYRNRRTLTAPEGPTPIPVQA